MRTITKKEAREDMKRWRLVNQVLEDELRRTSPNLARSCHPRALSPVESIPSAWSHHRGVAASLQGECFPSPALLKSNPPTVSPLGRGCDRNALDRTIQIDQVALHSLSKGQCLYRSPRHRQDEHSGSSGLSLRAWLGLVVRRISPSPFRAGLRSALLSTIL